MSENLISWMSTFFSNYGIWGIFIWILVSGLALAISMFCQLWFLALANKNGSYMAYHRKLAFFVGSVLFFVTFGLMDFVIVSAKALSVDTREFRVFSVFALALFLLWIFVKLSGIFRKKS